MRIGFSLLALTLVVGCARPPSNPRAVNLPADSPKAVYLVRELSQLSAEDLKAHPEVVVTHSFGEFSRQATGKIALWIDRDAIPLVDEPWLHKAPQNLYPLAVVGYCVAIYAFREKFGGFGIHGPPIDWNECAVEPGFSVWMIMEEDPKAPNGWTRALCKGYPGRPTVQAILAITNRLLEGKPPE